MAETLQRYRNAGIPIEKAMPKVFVAVRSVCVSFSGPNKNPRVLPFIFPFTITAPR